MPREIEVDDDESASRVTRSLRKRLGSVDREDSPVVLNSSKKVSKNSSLLSSIVENIQDDDTEDVIMGTPTQSKKTNNKTKQDVATVNSTPPKSRIKRNQILSEENVAILNSTPLRRATRRNSGTDFGDSSTPIPSRRVTRRSSITSDDSTSVTVNSTASKTRKFNIASKPLPEEIEISDEEIDEETSSSQTKKNTSNKSKVSVKDKINKSNSSVIYDLDSSSEEFMNEIDLKLTTITSNNHTIETQIQTDSVQEVSETNDTIVDNIADKEIKEEKGVNRSINGNELFVESGTNDTILNTSSEESKNLSHSSKSPKSPVIRLSDVRKTLHLNNKTDIAIQDITLIENNSMEISNQDNNNSPVKIKATNSNISDGCETNELVAKLSLSPECSSEKNFSFENQSATLKSPVLSEPIINDSNNLEIYNDTDNQNQSIEMLSKSDENLDKDAHNDIQSTKLTNDVDLSSGAQTHKPVISEPVVSEILNTNNIKIQNDSDKQNQSIEMSSKAAKNLDEDAHNDIQSTQLTDGVDLPSDTQANRPAFSDPTISDALNSNIPTFQNDNDNQNKLIELSSKSDENLDKDEHHDIQSTQLTDDVDMSSDTQANRPVISDPIINDTLNSTNTTINNSTDNQNQSVEMSPKPKENINKDVINECMDSTIQLIDDVDLPADAEKNISLSKNKIDDDLSICSLDKEGTGTLLTVAPKNDSVTDSLNNADNLALTDADKTKMKNLTPVLSVDVNEVNTNTTCTTEDTISRLNITSDGSVESVITLDTSKKSPDKIISTSIQILQEEDSNTVDIKKSLRSNRKTIDSVVSETLEPENHKFSRSWSQPVRGTTADTDYIDGFGINKSKDVSTEQNYIKPKVSRKNISQDKEIEDEDVEEDKNDDEGVERNEFIDDEADEVSDENSMDEEERQYIAEHEIPEDGLSLGSTDTDDDYSDNSNERDSFIVSDEDYELLDGTDDLLDDRVKTNSRKNKRKNFISSDDELNISKTSGISEKGTNNISAQSRSSNKPIKGSDIDITSDEDTRKISNEYNKMLERTISIFNSSSNSSSDNEDLSKKSISRSFCKVFNKRKDNKKINKSLNELKSSEVDDNNVVSSVNAQIDSDMIVEEKKRKSVTVDIKDTSPIKLKKKMAIIKSPKQPEDEPYVSSLSTENAKPNFEDVMAKCDSILTQANDAKKLQKLQNKRIKEEKLDQIKRKKELKLILKAKRKAALIAIDELAAQKKERRLKKKEANKKTLIEKEEDSDKKAAIAKALKHGLKLLKTAGTNENAIPLASSNFKEPPMIKLNVPALSIRSTESVGQNFELGKSHNKRKIPTEFEKPLSSYKKFKKQDISEPANIKSVRSIEKKKKKTKLNILKQNMPYDFQTTNSTQPKSQRKKEIQEELLAPKPTNFKIHSTLSSSNKDSSQKNRKRKAEIIEPVTSLSKPQWTSTNQFTVKNISKINSKKVELVSTVTNFTVTQLENKNKKRKLRPTSKMFERNSSAKQFKEKSIFNDGIRRVTSKELLQNKEKQKAYKRF